MTFCSNKAILSFVFYNFITAKMYPVCSAFHWEHYWGTEANNNVNDSDNYNDITKYHLVQGAAAHSALGTLATFMSTLVTLCTFRF